ncbi:MAG: hypothetical protein Tsb002_36010 [Wenzhouxiangellaceae bacterium]
MPGFKYHQTTAASQIADPEFQKALFAIEHAFAKIEAEVDQAFDNFNIAEGQNGTDLVARSQRVEDHSLEIEQTIGGHSADIESALVADSTINSLGMDQRVNRARAQQCKHSSESCQLLY